LTWPQPDALAQAALAGEATHAWLAPWLAVDGSLVADPDAVAGLLAAWPTASEEVRRTVRVSRHFGPWIDRQRRLRMRESSRDAFLADVAAGSADFDFVRHPLLPYQRDGVLHLAFGERALLADEMGLGKTVQAIAACELLARRRNVSRVLVVCPASLKTEWEEQIARFVERPARVVFGARAQRLAAYRDPAFFTIVNYEQVVGDAGEINDLLAADVVILDEAQRIKNWRTKTARRVKSLRAPFAFVLTGTPVENRIDEIYSIAQFLDPEVPGPLFRFNRDFYKLDEKGRPVDYQNLEELHRRLRPVMLRRRKRDVEADLPGRTVKTYFVAMAEEQRARYEDYQYPARQLIAKAQRRPLTQAEFDRLQQLLACMRMVCDSPAILDPACRISPKIEELEGILGDLLEDPDRKVIVFSEWERMLRLVRELAGEMGVECAWHTGALPQQRRRAEINRFKQDPACRLFLSTDSGSVGLNLQVASAVVNIDLPWNPAKLEQRIARAWRKNQTRSVTVVNLVAEDSIEHSILHLLGQKQALADGLLDGGVDFATLRMPSGRAAMIERMQAMLDARPSVPRIVSAEESVADDLRRRYDGRLLRVEAHSGRDGRLRLLAVLDADKASLAAEAARQQSVAGADRPSVELIDRETWDLMSRLADAGVLRFAEEAGRVLHRAPQSPSAPALAAE
jgi:SNF2 family DNA or RNA helicase